MRIATVITTLAILTAAAAPANACIIAGPATSYYLDEAPDDLEPNELLLEVRFVGREPGYKAPPYFSFNDVVIVGQPVTLRFAVVRVLHGKFTGGAILIPTGSGCGGIITTPPGGANTGLIAGFATPPSPDWDDSPALVARVGSANGVYGWQTRALEKMTKALPTFTYPGQPPAPDTSRDPDALMKQARDARDPYVRKDLFERAVTILRTRADNGDTSAMVDLAIGGDMRDDRYRTHNEWLERAARLGNGRAMFLLGKALDVGRSADLRPVATEWYHKAADVGYPCAMGTLAQRYRFGWGVEADREQALTWYRKAIAAGVIMSPYGYELGDEQPRDAPYIPSLKCPSY